MPTHASTQPRFFPALSGLRIVAAWMVFFSHYHPPITAKHSWLLDLVQEMHVGVGIFFVLSGFLIGHRYTRVFNDSIRLRDAVYFWGRRLVRLLPVFLSVFALVWSMRPGQSDIYWHTVTMTKGWFQDIRFAVIGPSWALTPEITFYLVVPFFLFGLGTLGAWDVRGMIRRLLMTVSSAICLPVLGLWLVDYFSGHISYGFMKTSDFMWYYTFLGRSWDFLLGALVGSAAWHRQSMVSERTSRWLTYISLGIWLLVLFWLSRLQASAVGWGLGAFDSVGRWLHNLVMPTALVGLLVGLIREKSVLQQVLSNKLMLLLGSASYVFFLIHYTPIAGWVKRIGFESYWGFFAGVNLLSVLIYVLYERPIARHLNTVLRSWYEQRFNVRGFWHALTQPS